MRRGFCEMILFFPDFGADLAASAAARILAIEEATVMEGSIRLRPDASLFSDKKRG